MRRPNARDWLMAIPPEDRDRAVEALLGIEGGAPWDSPGHELIGYHASRVAGVLEMIDAVPVTERDVVVDLGSGLGKVVILTRLLTGARARGVEIQASLVARAREASAHVEADVRFDHADARAADLEGGTVFFLYAPFVGGALRDVLARLEPLARPFVVCAIGLDLEAPWLARRRSDSFWLAIYDAR